MRPANKTKSESGRSWVITLRIQRVSKRRYQLTSSNTNKRSGRLKVEEKYPLTVAIGMSQVTHESNFTREEVEDVKAIGMEAEV